MNKCRITYPNNKEVRDDTSRTTKMFTSVMGHELIHAYDFYMGFHPFFAESRAYQYSAKIQIKYGLYNDAYNTLKALNYVAFPLNISNNHLPF